MYVNLNIPVYPLPTLSPSNYTFVFHICDSISVSSIISFIQFLSIPHISDMIYLLFYVWLTPLNMTVSKPIHVLQMCVYSHLSHAQLFESLWTVVHQAPLSMGFSRQEYWSGLSCPPPGDLPEPGIELVSCSSCSAGRFFTTEPSGRPSLIYCITFKIIIVVVVSLKSKLQDRK